MSTGDARGKAASPKIPIQNESVTIEEGPVPQSSVSVYSVTI
jgi:hypothetical protein